MGCLVLLVTLFSLGLLGAQQWVTPLAVSVPPIETPAVALPLYQDETGVVVSRFEVARDLDADGCPVAPTTHFRRSEAINVFAIGAFPRETTIFARMYYDGFPVEDTSLITASRSYDDVCVYFIFEPTVAAEVFDQGPYSVEFLINGLSAGSVNFVID